METEEGIRRRYTRPDGRAQARLQYRIDRLLEKKGVVGHESFGKSHRYYPLVDKETYADSYVRRVMGNFFDGSLSNLVSFFTEREDLSLAESERVIRLAEEAIRKRKDAGK